jgi:uncharacterized membrane protein
VDSALHRVVIVAVDTRRSAVTDPDPTPTRNTLAKTRMEAFSDGVFAIAVTLLVLDLALRPPGSPFDQFIGGWPTYLSYFVSFMTIGAAWIAHNALTDRLARVDTVLLRLNLLFLLLVAFLPYPTRLVALGLERSTSPEEVAAIVYGLTLLAIQVMFFCMDVYTRREDLVIPGAVDPDLRSERRKFRWVVGGYVVTIGLAFLVPNLAIGIYFAIAVFLVVPFRAVMQIFRGDRPE